MVDKQYIDEFVQRMEEMYHPSQRYAKKAKDILLKMLEPGFPDSEVPRIIELAEQMYRSHATLRLHLDAAQQDVKKIAANIGRIADDVRTMTGAYTSSVETIVRAGEEIKQAGEELHDAAQAQHNAGIELLSAALRLKDAAEQQEQHQGQVGQKKRDKN